MKRFVCFLLAMILIMGMVPATAVTAFAASERTTSDKAIEVLKDFEGFSAKVYSSGGKYYVGYGTQIHDSMKNNYPNGIKEADATALLKDYLKNYVDKALNNFAKINNLDLEQYEHDALALFSYSFGTAWLSGNGPLRAAVLQGKGGNEFINAIAQSHGGTVGSENFMGLINRRLAEANMYLNNSYGYNPPGNFGYVIFDNEGAKTVLAYNINIPIALSEEHNPAEKAGYKFLGWYLDDEPVDELNEYTADETLVAKYVGAGQETAAEYTMNTSSFPSLKVYKQTYTEDQYKPNMEEGSKGTLAANSYFDVTKETVVGKIKWVYGSGTNAETGKTLKGYVYVGKIPSAEEAANPEVIATATAKVDIKIHEGATKDSAIVKVGSAEQIVSRNQTVNIYEIKVEKTEYGNKSWGKVINVNGKGVNGWIDLAYASINEVSDEDSSAAGRTGVIINADEVNIRKTAEIKNDNIITTLERGTEVTVLETTMNGAAQWGRIKWEGLKDGYNEGWVYMYYVEVDGLEHSNPDGTTGGSVDRVQYTGVVTSNINLNVRKHADIYSTIVKTLPYGTKINIYETADSRNMHWGRIAENQWICLSYVNLTKVEYTDDDSSATNGVTSTQGTVTVNELDVLKNYNSNSAKVGSLKKGDVVTILEENTEITTTGSRIWGRISENGVEGWINLAYVDLKTVATVAPSIGNGSSDNIATATPAIISDCISVNVREEAGVYSRQITKLNNGTAITVYDQITYANAPWARIKWNNGANEGWVCMYYVTLNAGSTGTTENGILNGTSSNAISATGYVSNAYLNVRGGAGLGFAQIGTLNQNAKVTIFEQAVSDGLIWGRISYNNTTGWVCMSYITLENASSTGKGIMGTVARCHAKANVRSAPGTNNALVATVNVGSRVEVFETRTHASQKWGRIAQGWVCMDYVLLDSELPEGTVLDATTAPSTEATTSTEATDATVNKTGEIGFKVDAEILSEIVVYNSANSKSINVGKLNGDAAGNMKVDILALKNNGAELWGRIDQYGTAGWILMSNSAVSYEFTGYVNQKNAPVYVNADTSSDVKGSLEINKPMTFTKVTTDGEKVYGWVEENIYGWLPMSMISSKPVEVEAELKVFKSGETVGTSSWFTPVLNGTTFAELNAYDVIGGSKVLFKMNSGVKVVVTHVRFENGKIWARAEHPTDASYSDYHEAWFDLSKVNYSLQADTETNMIRVRSSMDNSSRENQNPNNIVGRVSGTVNICQLAFDSYGNLWARITGNSNAQLNGMFVMVRSAAQGVNGYEIKNYGKIFIGNHDIVIPVPGPDITVDSDILPEEIDPANNPSMT